jgi:hypothetical protein
MIFLLHIDILLNLDMNSEGRRGFHGEKVKREEDPLSFVTRNYICFSCLYGRYSGPKISRAMTIF